MDDESQQHNDDPPHPPLHQDSGFYEPESVDDSTIVEAGPRLPLLPLAYHGYRERPEEELLPRWAGCLVILAGFGWMTWCALYIPPIFGGVFDRKR